MSAGRPREVVLIGAGHAHVHVLEDFAAHPVPGSRVKVVADTPIAVYSGMVPGLVAGQYRPRDLEIDVRALARRARADVIIARATGIDTSNSRITLQDQSPVHYDIACFDIGSTVVGLDLPGIREHALPTRPIGLFARRVDEIVERARRHDQDTPFQVVVIGGGAGGVELAFTLQRRLASEGNGWVDVALLEKGSRILFGYPESLVRRVYRRAEARGIRIRCNRQVVAAEKEAVTLGDGERLPCQALIWVTGAVSEPIFTESGLPTDDRGFVRIRSTLQVEDHDDLFAVGDCATLIDYPQTPKAGVYAVRQGPIVSDNIRALLTGAPLRPYKPQSDFLTLLNLGDGTALGTKWGRSMEGAWVMKLKDFLDRRFMRRFQVAESGGP